jgi:hypothetical protein
VSSTEAIQRAAATALQVKIPIASAMASTPNPSVGEECRKADLNTAVEEDAWSLDLKVVKILTDMVTNTWKVHGLW